MGVDILLENFKTLLGNLFEVRKLYGMMQFSMKKIF